MTMTTNDSPTAGAPLRDEDNLPHLTAMQQALQEVTTHAADEIDRMVAAENTRFAWWEHQQDSGRLPAVVNGKAAEPWADASDVRVRLADELVNAEVRVCKAARRRAQLTVRGTEAGDMRDAGKVQLYLDHLRDTRLAAMFEREGELAAQWRATYGKCLTAVCWHQEWAREFITISREEIEQVVLGVQQAAQAGQQVPPEAIEMAQEAMLVLQAVDPAADPAVVEEALGALGRRYPDATKAELRGALRAWGAGEAAEMPQRYLRLNEPKRETLKLWRDVWMPTNCEEVQRAPWVAWRRTFTPAEVQEKALSEGWDEDFVEEALKTVGKTLLETVSTAHVGGERRKTYRDSTEEMDGLIEVFYFYHTASDRHGVPVKYLTVMSPHVPVDAGPVVGLDEVLSYDHGLYPFVVHARERIEREVVASRGIPEIVLTNQQEVKHQRDSRINQTDLHMQPPLIRPEREVGLPLSLRPRGEVGERRMNATREMKIANTAPAGVPLETAAREDARNYFARDPEDPTAKALYDQTVADDFCAEEAEIWRQVLKLCQQYEEEVTFQRIVGGRPSRLTLTRDEIQGEYDLRLYFNTDQLDPERMKVKIEMFTKMILPMSQGEIDTGVMARGLTAYYFPEFADTAIRDNETASTREIEDEELNWTRMVGGVEPKMAEEGQNFGLRLEWLQQQVGKPESMQLLQALPYLEPLVQRRLEHLKFMVQQKQVNAQTGRVGVEAA